MSEPVTHIVKCDCCGQPGRRRKGMACPDGWFFLESKRQSDPTWVHIVWACSDACKANVWKKGPGPNVIDEPGTERERARQGG